MRISVYGCSALVALVVACPVFLWAQQPQKDHPEPFYFVALTDPACPVSGYQAPVPVTTELRVLYFPMSEGATIKEPKALVLHLVFDEGWAADNSRTSSFIKREDGVWVATVPLGDKFPKYAIYWVEDRGTKQADTNEGKYFDVPFCDVNGQREEWSVRYEAESYTGKLARLGIDRPTDYAKAIDVLEGYIHLPDRGLNLISSLWRYKLKLGNDTPETRAMLLAEIKKFIGDHSADGFALVDALNFVAYQDWIPPDTLESLVKAIEIKEPNDNPRAFVLQAQATQEKDKQKRIALQWELVNKYPDTNQANLARQQLALEVTDLGQKEKLYQELRSKDPENPFHPWNLAHDYFSANQKLPEALALLDESDKLFAASVLNKQAKIHYFESTLKDTKLQIAILRGRILLRLKRPAEAVAVLDPIKAEFSSGGPYYTLGKALEDTGDKRGAIDAYLEAVVRPSTEEKKANEELEKLWTDQKRGTEQDLQQRIQSKITQNFNDANYVPRVLNHPAPDFDLTTLRGEHLASSQLRGKKIILDFWAVWCGWCLPELKPLQDFQEKHPEVVVATVVQDSTDAKQIEELIRNKTLTSLRISQAPPALAEKFGGMGVPNTFIIDEAGYVRIQHNGSIPDVPRYLEADLKAIADAGPAKEMARTSER